MNRETRLRLAYLALSAGLILVDQLTKRLIDASMALHERHEIVPGILQLTYVHNRGAAFGLFNTADLPYQAQLFSLVSLLALTGIVVYSLRLSPTRLLPQSALALIFGGAIGNLIDRLRHGYVIDFIDVYWGRYHWPMFNAADSAISVGVGLLILDMLREPRTAEPAAPGPEPAGRTE
jgi:signal peptidase II